MAFILLISELCVFQYIEVRFDSTFMRVWTAALFCAKCVSILSVDHETLVQYIL